MRGPPQTHKLTSTVLIFIAFMVKCPTNLGNSVNLVPNGDFEYQHFFWETSNPVSIDVTIDKMDYVPFFRVVHKGIQILTSNVYHGPGVVNGGEGFMLCHLNTKQGPGVLHTAPMRNPRKGAPYLLQFVIADNPDGGELVKSMRVRVLVNDRLSHPKIKTLQVSSPYSSQGTLDWRIQNISMVGTGESTKIQFESLMPGSYGLLHDNISVMLQTLIENGSFESSNVSQSLYTGVAVISAPSQDIPGWFVMSGNIKWRSASNGYQFSTDQSENFIDLNAAETAGTIASNTFSTKPGKKYMVLFDTTANAAQVPMVRGYMLASVYSFPGGKLLASRSVFVTSEGYNPRNLGWKTYELEFRAHQSQSFVQFSSQIEDSWGGPLLDNVVVYQVHKPGSFKHIAPTWSAGKPLKPYFRTNILAIALFMCTFWTSVI